MGDSAKSSPANDAASKAIDVEGEQSVSSADQSFAELASGDVKSTPTANEPPPLRRKPQDQFPIEERTSWTGAPLDHHPDDPLIGTTLHDTYVVLGILGEGGMGRVYEARHTRIQSKRYAIKVLHSEFSLDPDIRLRFQREAEAAASIEHDGVVGTYDVGQTPQGWPYMVCEYLSGKDLNAYLEGKGPLAASTVIHIGRQLCSALCAAHARGVIHRDLKPHNVFVLSDYPGSAGGDPQNPSNTPELPTVKVLDFGLSRFVESDSQLTKTGIILGTPGYMAPEQANGLDTDIRTDLYGIGALLFASATGTPPFKENTPQLTVLAVMNRQPPRPRELCPSIPEDLEIVIQKAMARDPAERYQSANVMEAALANLNAATVPHLRTGPRPQTALPSMARLRFSALSASGVILGGLSLLGALVGLLELKGIRYANHQPSILEWLLFLLLALFVVASLVFAVRYFKRLVWNNSARVAELTPRIQKPLLFATLAYGLSALLLRLLAGFDGISSGSLSNTPVLSEVVWYVVLPLNAALAASAIVLKDAFIHTKSHFIRTLTGPGYALGAVFTALCLLWLGYQWPAPQSSTARVRDNPEENGKANSNDLSETNAASPAIPPTKNEEAVPQEHKPPPTQSAPLLPAEKSDSEDDSKNGETSIASTDELAIASEDGAQALEELSQKYPKDSEVIRALVLAHASRADTLDKSAIAIAQLLDIEKEYSDDSDVLFILNKAVRTKGKASAAAFIVIRDHMGTDGADLLYQIMRDHPEQRKRLKIQFQELRKTQKASPEVLIAYDLKYASNCKARLQLLERAEKYGDRRSMRLLQGLSLAPKRCGGWGRTCYPPCKAEAKRFQRSINIIDERLQKSQ